MNAFLAFLRKLMIPTVVILICIGIAFALGAFRKEPEKKPRVIPPTFVQTMVARKADLRLQVVTQGTVEPRTETTLVPEVSGRITSVSPKLIAGGFFASGEVLLEIDPSDYEAALATAEAELTRRTSLLEIERARHEQARRDWENLGRGEASPLALNLPQLREAEANFRSAEAVRERARRNLERTRISVPYDGMVREKRADIGQYVTPGTPLARVFAVDYAEVRLPLKSADLAFLDLPQLSNASSVNNVDYSGPRDAPEVLLQADFLGERRTWNARLVRTEGAVDTRTRMIFAVARISDPYARLPESTHTPLPMGLFVEASIQGREVKGVISLPRQVLRPDGTVLVVTPEERIEVRPVEVLRAEASTVHISAGLQPGESIALTALEFVSTGMPVKVIGADGKPLSAKTPKSDAAASSDASSERPASPADPAR